MLFLDQRVTCGDVKIIPICRDKGPDPEVWTNKDGLDIYHGRLSIAVWWEKRAQPSLWGINNFLQRL